MKYALLSNRINKEKVKEKKIFLKSIDNFK